MVEHMEIPYTIPISSLQVRHFPTALVSCLKHIEAPIYSSDKDGGVLEGHTRSSVVK